ncbi:GapR family DNA-binding domain-containing protein [uncultured Enterovirga sp.]|uniref:DUF2312 domain-containing protein n=1 Tax=uncultured Enterovirga sp. TaxID=2026352 RepID=UPI0035CC4724
MSADIADTGVADGDLRQFVDRLLRLHEEKDGIGEDIKDVYAKLKGRGFDKTAMGALISHIRRVAKNPEAEQEKSALFDLYFEAWQRSSHTHAPAGTRATSVPAARATETARIEPAPVSPGPAETSVSQERGTRAPGEVHGRECAPTSPTHSPDAASELPGPGVAPTAASVEQPSDAGTPTEEASHEVATPAHGAGEGQHAPEDPAPVQPRRSPADRPLAPLREGGITFRNFIEAYGWPPEEVQARYQGFAGEPSPISAAVLRAA